MKEVEIWKPIKGYKNKSLVSSIGRVKNILTNKIVKEDINWKGYMQLSLCKNGAKKTITSHRLVAQAFVKNPENKPQVNHINGIKTDNHYKNLEWVTNKENYSHAKEMGLLRKCKGLECYQCRFTKQDLKDIRCLYSFGLSSRCIGRIYNCNKTLILKIVNGKSYKND